MTLSLTKRKVTAKAGSTGFTLVELLVVIAIIALLASLLAPAVSRAREKGKMIKCMSNQHQVYTTILNFVTEHNGIFPLASNQSTDKNQVGEDFFASHQYDHDPIAQVLICPSAEHQGLRSKNRPRRSIGIHPRIITLKFNRGDQPQVYMEQVRRPSELVLIGDCPQFNSDGRVLPYIFRWAGSQADPLKGKPADADLPLDDRWSVEGPSFFTHPMIPRRHDGKAVLTNADGSARTISHLSQLKQRNYYINY